MTWKPAPQALIDRFGDLVPDDPRIERRKMFGYPCAVLSGNLFMGLFQDQLMLRLGAADRSEMVSREGALPFQPMGRPMREYVVVPPALLSDAPGMQRWIARSIAFAAALPRKQPQPAQQAKAASESKGKGTGSAAKARGAGKATASQQKTVSARKVRAEKKRAAAGKHKPARRKR